MEAQRAVLAAVDEQAAPVGCIMGSSALCRAQHNPHKTMIDPGSGRLPGCG